MWPGMLVISSFHWQSIKCTPKSSLASFCVLLKKAVSRADNASSEAGLEEEPPSLGPPRAAKRLLLVTFSKQNFFYPSCPVSHKNCFVDVAFSLIVFSKSTPPEGGWNRFTPFLTHLINQIHQLNARLLRWQTPCALPLVRAIAFLPTQRVHSQVNQNKRLCSLCHFCKGSVSARLCWEHFSRVHTCIFGQS